MPKYRTDAQYIVDEDTGCWIWQWCKKFGYGSISIGGKDHTAHKVFYERAKGKVPDGLDLDHLCRNRSCVNPDHLEPVSRAVNVHRGLLTKLTPEQVIAIRQEYATGGTSLRVLGIKYGTCKSNIKWIVSGQSWKEVAA